LLTQLPNAVFVQPFVVRHDVSPESRESLNGAKVASQTVAAVVPEGEPGGGVKRVGQGAPEPVQRLTTAAEGASGGFTQTAFAEVGSLCGLRMAGQSEPEKQELTPFQYASVYCSTPADPSRGVHEVAMQFAIAAVRVPPSTWQPSVTVQSVAQNFPKASRPPSGFDPDPESPELEPLLVASSPASFEPVPGLFPLLASPSPDEGPSPDDEPLPLLIAPLPEPDEPDEPLDPPFPFELEQAIITVPTTNIHVVFLRNIFFLRRRMRSGGMSSKLCSAHTSVRRL
jgi:hypothetical protein